MIQARNQGIRAAIEEIKRISLSKRIRLHYEAYLKEKRDAWAIADYQKQQQKKEMEEIRKQGLEEGRTIGKTIGREEGREEGRVEGETRIILLSQRLLADRRLDDLQKALEDVEYRKKLCEEYHI